MADTKRLHAQARTSAHADNTTPTTTETPAALLLRAADHAEHLSETLKGLDALLMLMDGIGEAPTIDMQGPDLAHLLQPLRDKAGAHALDLLQLTDRDRLDKAHHTGTFNAYGLLDVRDHINHLWDTLSGLDALLSLLHAPDNARLPNHLTYALAYLLQPLHDRAADHTTAVIEGLEQVRKDTDNTAQGTRHA